MLDSDFEIRKLIQEVDAMKDDMQNEKLNSVEKTTTLLARVEEAKDLKQMETDKQDDPESVEVVLWKTLDVEDLLNEIEASNKTPESSFKRQNSLMALVSHSYKKLKRASKEKKTKSVHKD